MKKMFGVALMGALLGGALLAAVEYKPVADWLKLPEGRPQIGNQHGDVAVSSKGEVYVSVQDPAGGPAGLRGRTASSCATCRTRRRIFTASSSADRPDGEFIFGARLREQTIVKMTLDGKVVMTIPASADSRRIQGAGMRGADQLALSLTGMDVAPNGDLYVTDGYASDYIHRFDRTGKYLKSFGGKKEPYSFSTLHKLAIDTRFQPVRLIACDRANNRVVHLSLDGDFLGVVAKDLLLPAAVVISGDYAIVGELRGQVSVLDKTGQVVARLGTNTGEGVGTNQLKPELWQTGSRRIAARRRDQRTRRSVRLRVQHVRPRAPVQPAIGIRGAGLKSCATGAASRCRSAGL